VWQYGKKLSTSHNLKNQMQLYEAYYCDAVPQLSVDEDCISWKAVNVWKGVRQNPPEKTELSGLTRLRILKL
jgi:hypothetical protein